MLPKAAQKPNNGQTHLGALKEFLLSMPRKVSGTHHVHAKHPCPKAKNKQTCTTFKRPQLMGEQ